MNNGLWKSRVGKIFAALSVGTLLATAACGSASASSDDQKDTVVKVALTTATDEPIWDQVNKNLEEANAHVKVETVAMKSAVLGNQALAAGDVDLSAQQHYAFLKGEIKSKGYKLSVIADTYLSPLSLYSNKIKNVSGLKKGDKILIPNDETNGGRALGVLESAGVIKLDASKNDPGEGVYPHVEDITDNPSDIDLVPTDRNLIMSSLDDAAAGIANANAVVDYGRSTDDAIFKVDLDPKLDYNKPWINVIVARTKDKDNAAYKKIVKAYHTESVKKAIDKALKGSVVPVW
ncbi:MetQ/NlpA family ABC transporter substrate-binding protein [Bifidobacterium sp.]|jgi:D-methionine transport system substrate-binding protein|uniref:MetQ/NlpA family ABC transporter substrate-binding protein n=1 Tax=Bifidobacterium sp. TaxID=41200 RepID=UPI0025C5E7A4|nr:MetQ/NlpA family ABC transporter substrate-binding protein [Bifidobacterium sp.]MCI1636216.1 MetQ/NlpA family ABC transporter substrate-binding protein [Bifidobacterium sp.]